MCQGAKANRTRLIVQVRKWGCVVDSNVKKGKERVKKIAIVVVAMGILLQFTVVPAMAGERRIDLPPGPNMRDIPWLYVPGADPFHLLCYDTEAQKELGVTQEQLKKLSIMEQLFRSQLRELSYRPESSETRKAISRHMEAARNGLGRVLTPSQLERLRQMLLWIQGPCSVLKDDRLLARLQMGERQVAQMDTVCQELSDRISAISTETQASSTKKDVASCTAYSAIQISLKIVNEKAFALFSAEQKNIYTEISGKKFTFNSKKVIGCP